MNYKKLAIIGGGAAGFFCAANLPLEKINNKLRITIFEQHKEPMIKLSASGGARCNLTNNIQDINDLVKYYPRGEKFLYSVFNQFSAMDTINWFEEKNVKLYTDECGCVFPNSDNSETITNTLLKQIPKNITEIRPGARIDKVQHENGQFILFTNNRQLEFDFVLICTGGTYSIKGPIEDFKGYELAIQAGHTIVTAKPALSSMKIADKNIADLAGITINDITVVAYFNNKKIAEHSG
ncbi:MAG: aminoacetone oxidase family FAD-binding enzyme, partial [Cyanobacteriota bacterium]